MVAHGHRSEPERCEIAGWPGHEDRTHHPLDGSEPESFDGPSCDWLSCDSLPALLFSFSESPSLFDPAWGSGSGSRVAPFSEPALGSFVSSPAPVSTPAGSGVFGTDADGLGGSGA